MKYLKPIMIVSVIVFLLYWAEKILSVLAVL